MDELDAKPAAVDAKEPDAKPDLGGLASITGSLASIISGARALRGHLYVNATANGYLRLREYDKAANKWTMRGYLGALKPKREGTKRIDAKHREQYEQRKKRRGKGKVG